MRKAGVLIGALVGAAITAPLVAVLYLANQAFDVPFVPYVLFDWIGRVMPGKIITKVIDTMVEAIDRLNLGETSSTAKTIEHLLGIATVLGIGIAAGAVLFYALRRLNLALEGGARTWPGLAAGVIVGLPVILITRHLLYRGEAGLTDIAR